MLPSPSYLALERAEFRKRVESALELLGECRVCPRRCGVDRLKGETGYCGIGRKAKVASSNLHFGEEPPLSSFGGSGTIFFSGCNLGCVFCQNYPISQLHVGNEVAPDDLAEAMLSLQRRGAENINFVTPSHVVPQMLEGIFVAAEKGLNIPICYNSSGYDAVNILKLLDGVVDIYLPDFKYANEEPATEISDAPGYPEVAEEAIAEMYKQVGSLLTDEREIAVKGVIVRHLILPGGRAGTPEVMRRLAARIGTDLDVSLMTQYFPAHHADRYATMSRKISENEIEDALKGLEDSGIERCFFQGHGRNKSDH